MTVLFNKFKENFFAVGPIVLIVLILHFTISPISTPLLVKFIIGSVFVVLGLSIFLMGIDIGITPLGHLTGQALAKSNKLLLVIVAGLVLGFFVSIAEPGLLVLANQVDEVTSGTISSVVILVVVSVGLAVMVALGFIRIFYNVPLYKILFVLYLLIFGIAIFTSPEFLAVAFDASGATTGILAVPFILSLSVGISALKKDSKASEKDSFGLVAIASTGAILSVMLLNIISNTTEFSVGLGSAKSEATSVFGAFLAIAPGTLTEGILALLPLLVAFLVLQLLWFKLDKKASKKILKGFLYAFLGLILFFLGVNAGFMEVGIILGSQLASMESSVFVIVVGFVIGFVTIAAEPAVYVLTYQIEDVTSRYVRRKSVLIALTIGVGLAVALSVVRILVPAIQLWHYLLPGYIIAIALSFIVPKLFVGIAFDAGGVATGPMTATFILAYTQGVADTFEGASLLVDGFGMISMVALFPIITLEILGLLYKVKSRKSEVDIKCQ